MVKNCLIQAIQSIRLSILSNNSQIVFFSIIIQVLLLKIIIIFFTYTFVPQCIILKVAINIKKGTKLWQIIDIVLMKTT